MLETRGVACLSSWGWTFGERSEPVAGRAPYAGVCRREAPAGSSDSASVRGSRGRSPDFFLYLGPFWMLGKHHKVVNSRLIQHKINTLDFCQYCRIFLLEYLNVKKCLLMLNTLIHVTYSLDYFIISLNFGDRTLNFRNFI